MKFAKYMVWTVVFMLLSLGQAWAASDSWYAEGKAAVASGSPSGSGKVYVDYVNKDAAAPTAPAASSYSTSSSKKSASSKGASYDFYYYALPANDDCKFLGWSKTQGQTDLGTANPLKRTVTAPTASGTTTDQLYALFSRTTTLTFLAPANGAISATAGDQALTVPGAVVTAEMVTMTATANDGYKVFGWYKEDANGNKTYLSYTPTYKGSFTESTKLGAEIVADSLVFEASTLADLKTALAGAARVVTIPTDATITVGNDDTVTVPTGKKLTVDGALMLFGTLAVNGGADGAGKVVRVSKRISQGEVKIPTNVYTNYPAWAYQETRVSSYKGSCTGTAPACTVKWGVELATDGKVYEVNVEPTVIKCTVDQTIARNHIKTVCGARAKLNQQLDDSPAKGPYMFVLTQDQKIVSDKDADSGNWVNSGYNNFCGMIDAAGYTVTTFEPRSNFHMTLFNGKFKVGTCTNIFVTYVNCDEISDTGQNGKYCAGQQYLYDCGPTFKFSFTFSAEAKFIHVYSGTYDEANGFNDGMRVYGGSFKQDPSKYLQSKNYEAGVTGEDVYETYEQDGYYIVRPVSMKELVAKVGDTEYATLADAVKAANGAAVKLISPIALDADLTVDAGTTATIDLDGYGISGSRIVNRGTLTIMDTSTLAEKGTVAAEIVNYGTLDIACGKYTGAITAAGGTLTTHYGVFKCAVSEAGGELNLRGGLFTSSVEAYLDEDHVARSIYSEAETGYYYSVGEKLVMRVEDVQLGASERSFVVKPLKTAEDAALAKKYFKGTVARSNFASDAEWMRMLELGSQLEPDRSRVIECTLSFDRGVAANSVTGVGKAKGVTSTLALDTALAAGETYCAIKKNLLPGCSEIAFSRMLDGEFGEVGCGVINDEDVNIGTKCTLSFCLANRERDYRDPVTTEWVYKYVYDPVVTRPVVLGAGDSKAMIWGENGGATMYATLFEACTAASASGATVKLTGDCDEAVLLAKAGTFTLDANGFACTGSVAAEKGFELVKGENGAYTVNEIKVEVTIPEVIVVKDEAGNAVEATEEVKEVVEQVKKEIVENAAVKDVVENGIVLHEETQDEVKQVKTDIVELLKTAARTSETVDAEKKVEVANAITSDSEVNSYVKVELVEAKVATQVAEEQSTVAVAGIVFDVEPVVAVVSEGEKVSAVIPNELISEAVTFRLPLTDDFRKNALVRHEGDPDRIYEVCGAEGARYVDVECTHFSLFTAIPDVRVCTIGETDYYSLDAALAAAGAGDEIVFLRDVTLTNECRIAKEVVFNLGAYTLTAAAGKSAVQVVAGGALTVRATTGGIAAEAGRYSVYTDYELSAGKKTVTLEGGTYGDVRFNKYPIRTSAVQSGEAAKPTTVTISGGTFNGTFSVYRAIVNISGGTFAHALDTSDSSVQAYSTYKTPITVTGGRFATEPVNQGSRVTVGPGYFDGGCFVVGATDDCEVRRNGKYYRYASEAFATVGAGTVIEILKPGVAVSGDVTIGEGQSLTVPQDFTVSVVAAQGLTLQTTEDAGMITYVAVAEGMVAKIAGKGYYPNLESALGSAADGETVVLLADTTLGETVVEHAATLELNTHTVDASAAALDLSAGSLTIRGAGFVTALPTVTAGGAAKLRICGGTYPADPTAHVDAATCRVFANQALQTSGLSVAPGYYTVAQIPVAYIERNADDNLPMLDAYGYALDTAYVFDAFAAEDKALALRVIDAGMDLSVVSDPVELARAKVILSEIAPFANWGADFVVSFDRAVEPGQVALAGAYDKWQGGAWLSFQSEESVAAGAKKRLLVDCGGANDTDWTYADICSKVTSFRCGAHMIDPAIAGTTMTVELRLYDPTALNDLSKSILVSTRKYTFGGKVARIARSAGDAEYDSIAAALAAVQAGETVTVINDVDEDVHGGTTGFFFDPNGFRWNGDLVPHDANYGFFLQGDGRWEYALNADIVAKVISADGAVTNYCKSLEAAIDRVAEAETIVLLANNAENLSVNKEVAFTIVKGTNTLSGTVRSTAPLYDFEVAKDKGSCVYKAFAPVCEIGATQYSSMEKAFRLAVPSATVKMIADATNANTIVVSKALTLDLNGFSVTKKAETRNVYNGEAFRLVSSSANLTVTDSSADGDGEMYSSEAIAYVSAGALTVLNGTLTAKDVAIRQNGGTVTLTGGETRALVNAVCTMGGTLNVTGGKVTASGTAGSDRNRGQAILVDDYNGYYSHSYPQISAVITGGEIGSYSNSAVSVYLRSGSRAGLVTITGGKFRGGNAPALEGVPPYEGKIVANAGLYSTRPHDADVAYGFMSAANTNDETKAVYPWTIVEAPPVASITVSEGVTNYYWKLERAISGVAEGQTIDILQNNAEAIDVTNRFAFCINSHGHALTGYVKPSVYVSDDWRFVVNGDGTCSYCENPNRVKVLYGSTSEEFLTFADAILYANSLRSSYVTIRLMKDAEMPTSLALNRSSDTINLYGHKLTLASGAVLTVNGSNVLIKDGEIEGADTTAYVNVTGSDVEANSVEANVRFEASGSYGNVAMKNCTVTADNALTARDGSVILGLSGTYAAAGEEASVISIPETAATAHVIVKGGSYAGALAADDGFIDVRAGRFTNFAWSARNAGSVVSTGGTYDVDPADCIDEHYYVVTNSQSSYTVKCHYECRMVTEDGCSTLCWTNLQGAVDMIRAGEVAVIVLNKPTYELTIPTGCEVVTEKNGDQTVTVYTYLFECDQKDEYGNVTNTVKTYYSKLEDVVKRYENEVKRGNRPNASLPYTRQPTDVAPYGYEYIYNGTTYELRHKVYTCRIVDKSGNTLGQYYSADEAIAAFKTLPNGARITGADTAESSEEDREKIAAWFDERLRDLPDDCWNFDPTNPFKATCLTKEGYIVTRIRNADNTFTYSLELYVAQIATTTIDGPVTNVFTSFEAAIDAATSKTNVCYGGTIEVPNYDESMVAPDDWKFVRVQTGDSNTFRLVAKIYVCAIGSADGRKFESFEEAIDALAADEATGELLVIDYDSTKMFAPNGWCFYEREQGNWILAVYAATGDGGTTVSLKASGTGVDRTTVTNVIADLFVAEKVETMTSILGVKLTTINETNEVGEVVVPSGVQKVVTAAKTDAEENEETQFVDTLENATNVTIKVDVAVTPIKYVPSSTAVSSGELSFSLTPTATVTVASETAVAVNQVPVTNDMIDQQQLIAVSLYTGFNPIQIVHRADDGTFIKEYNRSEIAYDEATGVATVYVSHFSTLTAKQAPFVYVAMIGDDKYETLADAVKAAKSGDTIDVLGGAWGAAAIGTVAAADVSGKSLTIRPASGATVRFTDDVRIAAGDPAGGSLTVRNFAFDGAALVVSNCASVTVTGNTFTKATLDPVGPNFVKVTGATTVSLDGNKWNNELSGTVSGQTKYYTVDGAAPAISTTTSTKTAGAKVAATGLLYETVQAAVDAAADGGTVVVLNSVSSSESVTVSGKSVDLNLNGKTLTFAKSGETVDGIVYDGEGASSATAGKVYGGGTISCSGIGVYAATNTAVVVENVTVSQSGCAVAADNDATLTVKSGTFTGNAPVGTGAATGVWLEDGRYNLEPVAACFSPEYVAAKKGGWWTIGYLTVDTGADTTANFDSELTYSVSVEDVEEVVTNAIAAEAIKTLTRVEGVRLTISEQTVGAQVIPPGVQAVFDAACTRAAGSGNVVFTNSVKTATDIMVTVNVKVAPEKYVPTNNVEKGGLLIYDLKPVATVRVIENGVTNATQVVDVTNEMIDQTQDIDVTFYTGFKPEAVAHLTDEGYRIEMFTGDGIKYDETKGLTTVSIHRFSKLAAYEKKPLGVTVPNCADTASSMRDVEVPSDWLIDNFLADVDAAGTAANGEPVWLCYVLGMDPWSTDTFGTILPKPQSDGTVNVEFLNIEASGIKTDLVTVTFEFEASAEVNGTYQKVTTQTNDPVFENMQLDFDGTTVLPQRFFKNAKLVFTWK